MSTHVLNEARKTKGKAREAQFEAIQKRAHIVQEDENKVADVEAQEAQRARVAEETAIEEAKRIGHQHMFSVGVFPTIAIARVGNSTAADGWFYGPEVPASVNIPPPRNFKFKDAKGAVKRQVKLFSQSFCLYR
jgi:hypothetical protein